ncbi:FAS-associated factor 2-B [Acropora cervicornis]|uniref:FAS-associated factor 2-B n=1 Tax=Acropora cervicornis TaxID=6130 RepID=A0AAD9VBB5_ACRCE|nr:FAS-associated factor 2-B [Acropora cervicornis]
MAEANDDSVSRSEILAQFQDITGYSDAEKCRIVLERHNWDIETAVQDTLNEAEGSQPVFHPLQNSFDGSDEENYSANDINMTQNQVSSARNATGSPTPNTEVQRFGQSWLLWALSVPFLPFRFASSVLCDIFGWIARTTPLEDVLRFKDDFEREYGAIHPTFYQGSYSQALNDAKRELRFLLIYLHSSEHQDTEEFCRSTMTNEGFKEYVNGNMLFWAANVKSSEGYRVSRAVREATYPFLALICLRDNRMTVVGRMEGILTVDDYISRLARLIADNEALLVAARVDRQERTQAQQLREEQDEAYLESVRADQEKATILDLVTVEDWGEEEEIFAEGERKKREEEDKKRQEEEARRRKEEAKRNREHSIAQDRVDRKCRVPDEPDATNADSIRVLIKLSNGKRLERRFLKSHQLQALYDFVFCDEESPAEFVLVSNFPRKVYALDSASEHQTLEHAGIETNAMLFVQNIEEESDSD